MIVKKRDGSLVEVKRELADPELVLDSPDTDHLLANAAALTSRTLAAMQSQTHNTKWQPDASFAKQIKDLVEITLTIEKYKVQTAATDALAMLSDDELTAKLQKLAAKKLGS